MNLNYKTRVQEVKHINHIKTLVSYFQFFIWTYGAFFPPHDYKCTMQAGLYKIRLGLRPQKCYASLKKQSLPSSVKSRHYKLIQGTQFAYMQDVWRKVLVLGSINLHEYSIHFENCYIHADYFGCNNFAVFLCNITFTAYSCLQYLLLFKFPLC